VEFSFASEPDSGLYAAVNRGFQACGEGSVMSWVNSDDWFEQGAFASVAQILAGYPDILWLCGRGATMDEESALVRWRALTPFPRNAIAAGIFDGRFAPSFIMQESVFWRSSLWQEVGRLDTGFKLAGDHDLWRRFAAHTDLVVADSVFGYFRNRRGQLSEDRLPYCAEIDASLDRAQKRRRLLQAALHQFGFVTSRTATRRPGRGWIYNAINGLKIGPLSIPLVTNSCRPVPRALRPERTANYAKP